MLKTQRSIGIYVLVMAVLQSTLYAWAAFHPKDYWTFYFDPRLILMVLEQGLLGQEPESNHLGWISAAVLAIVALRQMRRANSIKQYIVAESALCAPNLLFFLLVLMANLLPREGFSIGELIVPVPLMLLFTGVPLFSAWSLMRRERETANRSAATPC